MTDEFTALHNKIDKMKALILVLLENEAANLSDIESLRKGREEAVKLVLDAGLSTGHADTCGDLMKEVIAVIETLRQQVMDLAQTRKHLLGVCEERRLSEQEWRNRAGLLRMDNSLTEATAWLEDEQ